MSKEIMEGLWPLTKHISPFGSNARVLAAIFYKNKLISVGINRKKTHPLQKKYGKNSEAIFLHAEIDAIIQAQRELTLDELRKSTLYIIRRKSTVDGFPMWGLAKPCCGCHKAINDYGIKKVVYSLDQRSPSTERCYEVLKCH